MNNFLKFYKDIDDEFSDYIRCCLLSFDIIFDEIEDINETINIINSASACIIVYASSEYAENILERHYKNCGDYVLKLTKPCNYETCKQEVCSFVSNLIANKKISSAPRKKPLIYQIVNAELEKLNLTKKYVGFKYLSDLLVDALKQNNLDPYNPQMFSKVAFINNVTIDSVEKDIRHMLMKNWKTSSVLKTQLNINKSAVSSRELLKSVIEYLRKLI